MGGRSFFGGRSARAFYFRCLFAIAVLKVRRFNFEGLLAASGCIGSPHPSAGSEISILPSVFCARQVGGDFRVLRSVLLAESSPCAQRILPPPHI